MRFSEDAFTLYESFHSGKASVGFAVGHWVYIIVPHLLKTPRLSATTFSSFHDAHGSLRRELESGKTCSATLQMNSTKVPSEANLEPNFSVQCWSAYFVHFWQHTSVQLLYSRLQNPNRTTTENAFKFDSTLDSLDTGFSTTGRTKHECCAGGGAIKSTLWRAAEAAWKCLKGFGGMDTATDWAELLRSYCGALYG